VRVTLGRRDVRMAEPLLDHLGWDAPLVAVRGEGVPEQMRVHVLVYPGHPGRVDHKVPETVPVEILAALVGEDQVARGARPCALRGGGSSPERRAARPSPVTADSVIIVDVVVLAVVRVRANVLNVVARVDAVMRMLLSFDLRHELGPRYSAAPMDRVGVVFAVGAVPVAADVCCHSRGR